MSGSYDKIINEKENIRNQSNVFDTKPLFKNYEKAPSFSRNEDKFKHVANKGSFRKVLPTSEIISSR